MSDVNQLSHLDALRNVQAGTEAPRRNTRTRLAVAVAAAAVIVTACVGFGGGDSAPTPSATSSVQPESTLPPKDLVAINAYINAVASGRGEPPTTYDVAADPASAAAAAYVDRYPLPGLPTLLGVVHRPSPNS
jgi:hypothetical protein